MSSSSDISTSGVSPSASSSASAGAVVVVDPARSSAGIRLGAIPVQSISSLPLVRSQSSLTQLVCDQKATTQLLETLLSRAGLSKKEAGRRLGLDPGNLRAYLRGARQPGLLWFLRFCELCGARVTIEFPART